MDKRKILIEQIDKLLDGSLIFDEFKDNFWSYYLSSNSDNNFTRNEDDYFAEIQETFDWTVENPTSEEREYGYLDWLQFIEFVKRAREIFIARGKLDSEEAENIRLSIKDSLKNVLKQIK